MLNHGHDLVTPEGEFDKMMRSKIKNPKRCIACTSSVLGLLLPERLINQPVLCQ